jgi:glycosyltransferase EpsF
VSARRLKVLHVVHALGMGGGETWIMELLRHWSRHGIARMDLLATGGERAIFDDEAERLGARIHYVPYSRAHLASFTRRFRRLLADGQYDAIHDHADYASGWHFLIGAGTLPRVRVSHVHSPWLHIESNYGVTPLRRAAAAAGKRLVRRFATDVCGTSAQVLGEYGFTPGSDAGPAVSVVHCGIDVAKFNTSNGDDRVSVLREFGWSSDARLVLFAGRLDRALDFDHPQNHKNSWLAVNVLRAAVAKDPAIRLVMAGAGTEPRRLIEAQIRSWGLQDVLRLVGVRQDMPRLMRAADVLFFPSRQEGLGMVAVEAQAAGLPVLASTAVPRECVVVEELYDAVALGTAIDVWADALLARIGKPRPPAGVCGGAVQASAFSIEASSRRLCEIYAGPGR